MVSIKNIIGGLAITGTTLLGLNSYSKIQTQTPLNDSIKPSLVTVPDTFTLSSNLTDTIKPVIISDAQFFAQGKRQKSVELAQEELEKHVRENWGENDSRRIRVYRGFKSDAPWCASFVNYVTSYAQGLGNLFRLDRNFKNHHNIENASSSQAIKRAAIRNRVFENINQKDNSYTPQTGDLIIWQNTKEPNKGHIGIVEQVNEDGSFTTIEGNTDDALKRKHYSSIKDAMRPKTKSGEYNNNKLVGFVNMEKYYENLYNKIHKKQKLDIKG